GLCGPMVNGKSRQRRGHGLRESASRAATWHRPLAHTPRRYFGLIDGLPPGVPGGGMTGMLSPEGGGVRFICGSTPGGGVTTPPDRPKSELLVPLAGGAIGRFV